MYNRQTYDVIYIRAIKKDDLRRSLSMVIQDTHLFTGTIADNIRYGRLDATDGDVVNAAKVANAHSFIRRLPQGYDTVLPSDGSTLSPGQRQLLAIARAAISLSLIHILSLSYINYALSACVGGLFALAGLTDLGTLASYLVYVRQSAMPMNQFTQQINFLLAALSGAERIFDMMNEGQESDEGSVTLCNVAVDGNGEMKECAGFTQDFARCV